MNKLRDEIINRCIREDKWIVADVATVAQEVALKWIEKAHTDGYYAMAGEPLTEEEMKDGDLPAAICWKRWLRENNLSSTTKESDSEPSLGYNETEQNAHSFQKTKESSGIIASNGLNCPPGEVKI